MGNRWGKDEVVGMRDVCVTFKAWPVQPHRLPFFFRTGDRYGSWDFSWNAQGSLLSHKSECGIVNTGPYLCLGVLTVVGSIHTPHSFVCPVYLENRVSACLIS